MSENKKIVPIFNAGQKITNGRYTVDILSVQIEKQRYLILKFPVEIIKFEYQNEWKLV